MDNKHRTVSFNIQLGIIFSGAIILGACSPATTPIPSSSTIESNDTLPEIKAVELDKHFVLAMGEQVQLISEDLTIEFLSISTDSRCPTGMQCFIAGWVTVVVLIHKDGDRLGEFTLSNGDLVDESDAAERQIGNLTIHLLSVHPYPQAQSSIQDKDYTAELSITANPLP